MEGDGSGGGGACKGVFFNKPEVHSISNIRHTITFLYL